MTATSKIFFISDLHLGVDAKFTSIQRERLFVKWLEKYGAEMNELYVVGDLFDFWFEYKKAVPRGFTRAIGSLALLADSGVKIHFFTGNHDLWIFDYLPNEIGCTLHRNPITQIINGKKFFIGHGDGLGPGDYGYKFLKKVFTNPLAQWLFRHVHPDIGIRLAQGSSRVSRKHTGGSDAVFTSKEQEWLYHYCLEVLQSEHVDYFIFGHRHLPLDLQVGSHSRYINLGEWLHYQTYAVWNGTELELRAFESDAQFIKG
ncbi:UDP-2,3-diacylglucosamine hydrolase [Thermaurantimonas aggregans]|uniref:UDP-2,3-diacylglucosamine hydrolase n=1 Tax=Thermaurantimonas aggregans TaxID=2173829 RepID=A0A401XID8_9FLAO|nr:UDP-2,3-diacylglucosamine diphosphatase [Thermaurantimonas aggregans]MCX8149087.1 UDP-2,3-diacylglucosamine diphosphatase [Thermaurantimonas aggregans]GCD76779.1 UDP-2,3-diacylglucosamine hydrolase [Thermaurantimonas aggregans]